MGSALANTTDTRRLVVVVVVFLPVRPYES